MGKLDHRHAVEIEVRGAGGVDEKALRLAQWSRARGRKQVLLFKTGPRAYTALRFDAAGLPRILASYSGGIGRMDLVGN